MTDARLPGRWINDPALLDLSDRLWRVHTLALMWSAEQGTDGAIPVRMLRLLHPDGATLEDARALIGAGLWASEGAAYRVLRWEQSQSLAADVERARVSNRERQARHRAKTSAAATPKPGHVTRDVTGESPRQGQARQGQARTGQASEVPGTSQHENAPDRVGLGAAWPTRIPGTDAWSDTYHREETA
jgi:hypothetical protein